MNLFNVIWEGAITGIALSLMLGTVFFSLLRNSITYGQITGVFIASGVIVCDILFILLALLSDQFAIFLKKYHQEISLTGGIVLIIMGIIMFRKASPNIEKGKLMVQEAKNKWHFFLNGFFLNLLNPVNFFSWLAISTMLTVEFGYSLNEKYYFFTASLCSIFLIEILIAIGASKVKRWVTPLFLKRINQISGLVFIGVGLKLASGIIFS